MKNMPASFQEGDLVRLRGSGDLAPRMSVQIISADAQMVLCMWFDSSGGLHEKNFHMHTLEKVDFSEGAA